MAAYRTVSVADVAPIAAVGGTVRWHPLRATLGIRAFGVNAYSAQHAGDMVIEEHVETTGGAGGHEELYVVLAGRARFSIDGDTLDAPTGTCVFLPDPAARRAATAEEPGTVVLAVGGEPGKPYEVSPWEYNFRANPHIAAGDWDAAMALMREGLEQHPGNASLLYNLACFEARAGRLDAAAGHLREAHERDPEQVARWARDDEDLAPLRGRADFPL